MVYSVEQKTFMLESYFRNAWKINGQWSYLLQGCIDEFQDEIPHVVIVHKQL
ncbi:hypothetical protein BDFB_009778 [Asbolus verrucosus]|uniref:Uncharacterized protein n=1 Tax=Asbolus verrucosus TaxID=1661398 RepID=A0A482VRC0_ASBVE|nr:hypothetical protein BDFB_009778 [Asbolus verrucosus]